MVRGLGPELGAVIAAVHRDHGVDLRTGVHVEAIEGDERRRRCAACGSATARSSRPTSSSSGSACSPRRRGSKARGSRSTTAWCATRDARAAPDIVAAGDVARWPNLLFDGASMRLEHWTNATEQGVHAARRLLGDESAFAPVPFVWSDQYDRKIQTVGVVVGRLPTCTSRTARSTSGSSSRCSARDGRITGALGFNRPRNVMQYRRLIAERASWDDALQLANA